LSSTQVLDFWAELFTMESILPVSGLFLWRLYIYGTKASHNTLWLSFIMSYAKQIINAHICYFHLRRVRHGRDRLVVRFTTTWAISAYHH